MLIENNETKIVSDITLDAFDIFRLYVIDFKFIEGTKEEEQAFNEAYDKLRVVKADPVQLKDILLNNGKVKK